MKGEEEGEEEEGEEEEREEEEGEEEEGGPCFLKKTWDWRADLSEWVLGVEPGSSARAIGA